MKVLALMSGTSLDGLDVALCEFKNKDYTIAKAKTFSYPLNLAEKLKNSTSLSGLELLRLDRDWAEFAVSCIESGDFGEFDLLASHGHTVFHKPEEGLTFQLGSGAVLCAGVNVPVVCDFRRTDVARGGQGAPLVPAAEVELFSSFQSCLNLGGIANVTLIESNLAFDICPCNLILNSYAQKLGSPYDSGGEFARGGRLIPEVMANWEQWGYYGLKPPKSLAKEDLDVFSIEASPNDMLTTAVEHISSQIAAWLTGKTLITGGGAYNRFLIEKIESKAKNAQIFIPDPVLIEFKEALCFAFLGWKRFESQKNTFSRFTGANRDSSSGSVYLP
jgi:anhydro-N-acetylmuramic acid kinase